MFSGGSKRKIGKKRVNNKDTQLTNTTLKLTIKTLD